MVTPLIHPRARLVEARTGRIFTGPREISAEAAPVLAPTPTTVAAIHRYLAAFTAGTPIALLDPELPMEPFRARFGGAVCHPDLAVLLASGSRLVRLSRTAVLAGAESIATALGIGPDDVAITSLPLFSGYGLSVLNSHLIRGATVVVEPHGLLDREFWTSVDAFGVTSLAAVPHQYELLCRIGFDPRAHPGLKVLTQAGGRLRPDLIQGFAAKMRAQGTPGRMYVMYGASTRVSVLPPDRLPDKLGSVGRAIPGGSLSIEDGEVVYRGPNVMMGYAECAADLARGDDLGGVLRTGDPGHLDEDGLLYLTGQSIR